MARVYLALDRSSGRRVALKLHAPREERSLERDRELFQREFHTLIELAHPRIVATFDYGQHAGQPYYTMELLDGGDLRARSPLPWREACAVGRDVCAALALLHSRRMVHRDLSPSNVRLTADGTAKLIDFGAMAPIGSGQPVVCTPAVASPELLYRQSVDGRSDLYALGATLYCTLVGHMPYAVRGFEQLPDQWRNRPQPPSTHVPGLPAALDALVMELLQLDPQLRPSSAAEVGQRLCAIAGLPQDEQLDSSQAYLTTPQLVGRERELALLRTALDRVQRGNGGAALLVRGARGLGRSRLLDACGLAGKLAGFGAVQIASAALAPGAHALARALVLQLFEALPEAAVRAAEHDAGVLCAVLPELREKLPEAARASAGGGDSAHGAALREFVLRLSSEQPLSIAIDDLEHADAESLALVALLAHEAPKHALLLVASCLGAESGADQGSARDDALRAIARHCTLLPLYPLDEPQTHALLASMLGDVPNLQLLQRRVQAIAGGNPQHMLRLCQHLLDRGVLRFHAGSWILPDRLDVADLPSTMAQAFAATVAALDDDARELARTLALCPDDRLSQLECVRASADGDPARTHAALARLVAAGVVVPRGDSYALAAKVWVSPLMNASDGEVALLEARLAAVFEQRGDCLRAARHLFRAGRNHDALDALLFFSEEGRKRTIAGMDAYIDMIASLPRDWREVFDRALALCDTLARPRRDRFALEQRLSGIISQSDAASEGHHAAVCNTLAEYAGVGLFAQLDLELPARERMLRALAAAAERHRTTPEADRVLAPKEAIGELARAVIHAVGGLARTLDVEEWARVPSLAPLCPISPAVAVVDRLARGFSARIGGRYEQARAIYAETLQQVENPGHGGLDPAFADSVRAALPAITGMIEAVLGQADAERTAATVERHPLYQGSALAIRELARLWQGDVVAADRLAVKRELWRLEQSRQQASDVQTVLWLLPAHAACDDLTRTRQCLDAIARTATRLPTWQPIASWARAEYERIRGDHAAALVAAEAALLQLPAGRHPVWPLCAATRAKVLCEQGRFAEARARAEEDLAHALAAELGFMASYLRMPLALACAQLGDAEAAWQHARAAIAGFEAVGATGLNVGLAQECAAYVAAVLGQPELHAQHARQCEAIFLAHPNAALAAKYQRLVRAGRPHADVAPSALPEPEPDARLRAQLESALRTCSDRPQRLERALVLLIEATGAHGGALFAYADGAVVSCAQSAVGTLPPEIASMAARHFQTILGAGSEEATAAFTQHTRGGLWTSSVGHGYRPVLLGHQQHGRFVVSGLVVLRCEQLMMSAETALTAAQLSKLMVDHGDLAACAVG